MAIKFADEPVKIQQKSGYSKDSNMRRDVRRFILFDGSLMMYLSNYNLLEINKTVPQIINRVPMTTGYEKISSL